jgi:hypothetical protein
MGNGKIRDGAATQQQIKPKAEQNPDRPTEDDLVREHLGGTRGDPSLGDAPMTDQRRKKTFPDDESDGHVA